jgi:hypothetical protein
VVMRDDTEEPLEHHGQRQQAQENRAEAVEPADHVSQFWLTVRGPVKVLGSRLAR